MANDTVEDTVVCTNGVEYTRTQLLAAFERITNKDNWKLPLHGTIKENEFDLVNDAAIFFAGSPLSILKRDGDMVEVHGLGYYAYIGA